MKEFFVPNTVTSFSNDNPFVLIAGPCQVESKDHEFKNATFSPPVLYQKCKYFIEFVEFVEFVP